MLGGAGMALAADRPQRLGRAVPMLKNKPRCARSNTLTE
jgi:hypothetical protein